VHEPLALDPNSDAGANYVRTLQSLKYCKGVLPQYEEISGIKQTFETQIGADSVSRIIAFNRTKMDYELAQRELIKASYTHRAVLRKSLSWPYWIRYQTLDRVVRVIRNILSFL
jgi:hypothetical protein